MDLPALLSHLSPVYRDANPGQPLWFALEDIDAAGFEMAALPKAAGWIGARFEHLGESPSGRPKWLPKLPPVRYLLVPPCVLNDSP